MSWGVIEFDGYITPDGILYPLVDSGGRSLPFAISGQGMPPIDYITQKGPLQDGETVVDYRLKPRTVQMLYRQNGNSRDDYWEHRAELVNALRPNRQAVGESEPGILVKTLPDGTRRYLNVYIDDGPKFQSDGEEWDAWAVSETLRFTAYDPLFYNPSQMSVTATSGLTLELVFPITFPIRFDSGLIDITAIVNYAGTWKTYPTIVITGPLDQPQVINATTGLKVQLDYNVATGETVTITLDGAKTVTNQLGTNLIGTVSTDSSLATFAIVPAPTAPNGNNQIQIRGANADSGSTSVVLSWYDKYIGI